MSDSPALQALLSHQKIYSQQQLMAYQYQAEQQQQDLFHYLIDQQLIDDQLLATYIASYYQLNKIAVNELTQWHDNNQLMNSEQLACYQALLYKDTQNRLSLVISNPEHIDQQEHYQFKFAKKIKLHIVSYWQLVTLSNTILNQIFYKQSYLEKRMSSSNNLEQQAVDIIQHVINDAIHRHASDIHIESHIYHLTIRFRLDGLLHTIVKLPESYKAVSISYLKVQANLDIAEKRLPQDGRFQFTSQSGFIRDCRISTCPSLHGEKIVIRLLSTQKKLLDITKLGLSDGNQAKVIQQSKQPQGLVLVTGPTGSGKTITLYAMLNLLNQAERNIMTVEDPVEIQLNGINQVSINPAIQLDFAQVLRTFLRQDPDIIMLGEIRDLETASIAVRAAHTGHLVIATLHTNSAIATLTRLNNMGIEAFNIVSTVKIIMAQRLLRRLCMHCKKPELITVPDELLLANVHKPQKVTVYSPVGCELCNQGYQGRLAIFEIVEMTPSLSEKIIAQSSEQVLFAQAKKEGMQTLRQAAWEKVQSGETSIQEMYRVLGVV